MKRIRKQVKTMLMAIALIVTMTIAIGMPQSAIKTQAATISLNKTKVTLKVGQTVKLKVKGTTKKVRWSSDKKKVATVNNKGKVTAKKAGKAIITAKVDARKLSCKVKVKNRDKSDEEDYEDTLENEEQQEKELTLSANRLVIDSKTEIAAYYGDKKVNNYDVNWSTSDGTIASVGGGTIYPKGNGTVIITASYMKKTAQCEVRVVDDAALFDETKELTCENRNIVLGLKDKSSCEAGLKYGTSSIAGSKAKWTSTDESIATVYYDGKIHAKKAGKTTLTATFNEKSVTMEVTVVDYAEGYSPDKQLSLNPLSLSLKEDESAEITVRYGNDTVSKYNVTWQSMNENVATVSYGRVNAKGVGTTVITASYNGLTASCSVNVAEMSKLDKVKAAIVSKGYTNGNGHKTVKLDLNGYTYMVEYNEMTDSINLGFLGIKSNGIGAGGVDGNSSMTGSAAVHLTLAVGTTNQSASGVLDIGTYTENTKINFVIKEGKAETDVSENSANQDTFNQLLSLIVQGCDLALWTETGYNLSDAGFTSFK